MNVTFENKADLRRRLRAERVAHAEALPAQVRALIFHRPPRPILELIPAGATIGLYHATPGEAPTGGYARFFLDLGHAIALPWFADRGAAMAFRLHSDPFDASDLVPGPFGLQPESEAEEVQPDVLFAPLVGFTANGHRLGQGGGHYDRWLGAHPEAISIGMAWDMQEIPDFAAEPHDVPMRAVVTPTRVLGPFA